MPGLLMSNVYLARPVTLSGPSSRLTDVPITEGFAGHAYFGSAGGGGAAPPRPPCAGGCCDLPTSHPFHARDRLEDSRKRAAATDIAVEPTANLFGSWRRIFFEQRDAGH